MSLHAIPCWQVRCDWPGCTASPADVSEYSGWGDKGVAVQEAVDCDWFTSPSGLLHYCPDHPMAWASDREQVESMPGAYLLIHDGDTDTPAHDDGHVTLIGTP